MKPLLFPRVRKGAAKSLTSWARANSMTALVLELGCCSSEIVQAESCRYDTERLGLKFTDTPESADLLIICGSLTEKLRTELKSIYQRISTPKYVMCVGTCACSGGPFKTIPVEEVVPVDVFVPGCPPRPEAVLHGVVTLQEKIRGQSASSSAN